MKKKLALLMAAIMTVAMVPMTALAAAKTKLTVVDQISVGVDDPFTSKVEIKRDEDASVVDGTRFQVELTLENGKFTKAEYEDTTADHDKGDEYYVMDSIENPAYLSEAGIKGVASVDVKSDTRAVLELSSYEFNGGEIVLPIKATSVAVGEVVAKFSTNKTIFADVSDVIAVAYDGDVKIESAGVVTFVEDSTNVKNIKDITIDGLVNGAVTNKTITLKLKGNYEFYVNDAHQLLKADGSVAWKEDIFTGLNDIEASDDITIVKVEKDEVQFAIQNLNPNQLAKLRIGGFAIKATKSCDPGDVAKLTISSKDFDSVTLEIAKMVEEAVTYTVEDKELPVIYAGKNNDADETNTLKVSVEENTGDILNTSRKATFTFPEGIEVKAVSIKGAPLVTGANLDIDENVVTIRNYQKKAVAESNSEKGKTDFDIKFVLNAAPTFDGDVKVTLGGEFDDVEYTVATVKAPYTIEAKTSEVLIDYRYVPVNEIVITEAEDGILEAGDKILLAVEKMEFEDAGSYEVTEGDLEIDDVEINSNGTLEITIDDESTEASTIVISGLELYLDRTLPVGGYALTNEQADNVLWENSSEAKKATDNDKWNGHYYDEDGIFKYSAVTVNDSYVEVVTQARDQDDYTTNRKIVITIGATTMAVGTDTLPLETPAYINAENYTELPLRAVSEALDAKVQWDDATKTVTIMRGQRIVSMTIGSKTMYINGTPVAMNTAPEITNNRTFVPVRDLANALGISKIDWNEAAQTVTLN